MSVPRVKQVLDLWRTQLPNVAPFYAVKCNPDPHLLNTLYDAGVGFDCASERELLEVKKLARGTAHDRIVYANPCKSGRDLAVARSIGAPLTVVDSVEEVEKLGAYAGGALIRIAVDDTGSAMPFSSKFGACPGDVERISATALARGLSLRGISFHVGSGCSNGTAYQRAIEAAYQGVMKMTHAGHKRVDTIDIGGGYMSNITDFKRNAIFIRSAMLAVDSQEAEGGFKMNWIAEPGRFIASNAFDFFVQVIGKKRGDCSSPSSPWKYTIDDSLYGQFSSILFDYAKPEWVRVRRSDDAPRQRSAGILFGRTCDSVDVIAKADSMEELEVGDWLWFPSMGAYTRATASEFNGFPSPEVFIDTEGEGTTLAEVSAAAPTGIKRMPPVSARAFWA